MSSSDEDPRGKLLYLIPQRDIGFMPVLPPHESGFMPPQHTRGRRRDLLSRASDAVDRALAALRLGDPKAEAYAATAAQHMEDVAEYIVLLEGGLDGIQERFTRAFGNEDAEARRMPFDPSATYL